jgi:hypothetical protein
MTIVTWLLSRGEMMVSEDLLLVIPQTSLAQAGAARQAPASRGKAEGQPLITGRSFVNLNVRWVC